MLLRELCYGPGWKFLTSGGLQGIFLSITYGWQKLNIKLPALVG
jgi:hypothetical protein